MPPRYKKRRIPSDDDEEYEPNMDESDDEDEDDDNEQNTFMQNIQMTSSGRLIRPSKIKKEPRSGSEEFANVLNNILLEENTSNLKPQSGGLKRIKVHDMDKTYAPDLSKISRYLMAVKRTYANSKNKLVIEEERRLGSNEPSLARLLAANENDELNAWKRVDEISPSLARWLGTKSISLVVHGTVPIDVLERGENGNVDLERRPLPTKIQMKRGRPRKDESDKQKLATDVDSKKKKREVPPAKLMDKTPITVNERLKSLVDESIARCSVAREQPTSSPRRGRRTNNSLAIALSQQPSTSSTPMQSAEQTTTSSSPFPQLKKIKLEIEDFTLPSEFSTGLKNHRFSIPSSSKMPFPSTSKQTPPISKQQITNAEQLPPSDSPKKKNSNSTFLTPKNSQNVEKKISSSKGNAEIYLPIKIEDGAKINRLALFKAQTFKFDVDRSPAVQNYESVQVVDIFHTLPTPGIIEGDEQMNQPATSNVQMDSISTKADQICNSSGETSMSTIDRLVLRQGKKPSQYAQALFCGGPLAAISVCPNSLPNGHELFAIATFADEKSLEWPENDTNSYLQLWRVNPNELNESAKMAFLLRVPNVTQICSLAWCPSLKDRSSNGTASSLSMPNTSSTIPPTSTSPLGLLAIGTNNGRILIYRIPRQLDQFLSRQQQIPSPIQSSIILETLPFLTLHHPKISVSIANSASRPIMSDSIPMFSLKWSPFVGARHIAAISASGSIYIWDILQNEPKFPHWSLNLEDRQPPPTALSWMESDKICITSRHRQLRVYKLLLNNSATNQQNSSSFKLVSECDTTKSVGAQCCTSPLIFPGLISFDSIGFNYFGNIQQAPCYIWAIDKGNSEQICGTNLSNCHQIRLSALSVCPQSGICASTGTDGRLVCSLNGRMSPRDGLQREMEVFIHGRTLLQLISHNKKKLEANNEDEENMENGIAEDKPKFCYSHEDCCAEKLLEIRLGDCALLEQKNERACGRRAPEICLDRRLESLTAVDFSHNTVGLTFCGGDSGLVFIVPCTL